MPTLTFLMFTADEDMDEKGEYTTVVSKACDRYVRKQASIGSYCVTGNFSER